MEDYIIVLGVGKPYDISSEDGSHITGCSMSYIATADINAVNADPDSGELGYIPIKAQGLPASAKVVYGMKNSGGKQTLYIKELDFVGKTSK